jgi:hypothetical protein
MSNIITQKIYEESYTDELYLQRSSDARLAQYENNDFSFLNDTRTINIQFEMDSSSPKLIEENKEGGKHDGENAELFYNAYKSIPIDLAFNKTFWAYMTHNNFRSYVMCRFVNQRNISVGTIESRFFTQSFANDRGLERNALARLWWAANKTTNFENDPDIDYFFESVDAPYFYTKILCNNQNLFVQALGHSFGRNKKILLSVLRHTANNDSNIKDKKAFALYISNRICLYEHNNTLIYSSPEEIMNILKDIAPV